MPSQKSRGRPSCSGGTRRCSLVRITAAPLECGGPERSDRAHDYPQCSTPKVIRNAGFVTRCFIFQHVGSPGEEGDHPFGAVECLQTATPSPVQRPCSGAAERPVATRERISPMCLFVVLLFFG